MTDLEERKYITRKSYDSMKGRCGHTKTLPTSKYYINKGIKVCDRWLESYDNFVEDMGLRPRREITLDRIDNSLGYCPDNCRWASQFIQNYNKSVKPKNYHFDSFTGKWLVSFQVDYKIINMGRFEDEATAKKVASGVHRLIDRFIDAKVII